MYLKKIERLSQKQLFKKLRQVTLLGQKNKLPYIDANFKIRMAWPQDFQPSTFYVLKNRLELLALLIDELTEKTGGLEEIDSLLEYQDEFGFLYRMIPPVVELADFGEWIVLDGEHRCFIAMQRQIEIPMLFIENVSYLYPCLPLPDGWKSVKIADTVPELKRLYRQGLNDTERTRYNLHRDLGQFGSQKTRKPFSLI